MLAILPLLAVPAFGFGTLLGLLFVVAAGALLWWGFSRIAIPEPIKTILLVVVGLIMLYFIWQMVAGAT